MHLLEYLISVYEKNEGMTVDEFLSDVIKQDGIYEYGDVQSGHREEGYCVRDRGRVPVVGRCPEDDKISEY